MSSVENFNYEIIVTEINPPIGGVYRFAAKVGVITEHGRNVRFHQPNLGEVHGKTKEEARDKMDDLIIKWFKKFRSRK